MFKEQIEAWLKIWDDGCGVTADQVWDNLVKETKIKPETMKPAALKHYVTAMLYTMDPLVLLHGHNFAMDDIKARTPSREQLINGREEHPRWDLEELLSFEEVWRLAYKLAPCCKTTPEALLIEAYFDSDVWRLAAFVRGFEVAIPTLIGQVAKRINGGKQIKPRRTTYADKYPRKVNFDVTALFGDNQLDDDTFIEAIAWVLTHDTPDDAYEFADEVEYTYRDIREDLEYLLADDTGKVGLLNLYCHPDSRKYSLYELRKVYFEDEMVRNADSVEKALERMAAYG